VGIMVSAILYIILQLLNCSGLGLECHGIGLGLCGLIVNIPVCIGVIYVRGTIEGYGTRLFGLGYRTPTFQDRI